MLKQYGKTPAELKILRDGFLAVLSDIPVTDITKALFVHLNTSDEIPTPKQLRQIIYPPVPEPEPLSASVYVKYQKMTRDGHILLSDERAYCRAYEAQEMAKTRGGSAELRQARAEVDSYAALTYGGDAA